MQTDQILHRLRAALAAAVAVVALAAPATAPAAAGSKAKQDDRQYYVSLGDSYSTGYQPAPGGGLGSSTKDGYAYVLPKLAKKRGYDLKLVNFGCGGETTTSILERTTACLGPALGGPDYAGTTQAAAAASDPFGCVSDAVQRIKTNLVTLAQRLRAAAGSKVKIVGLTYPDVILGLWVSVNQDDRNLAAASVVAFRDLRNPTLPESYESVKGVFVEVTATTGA